MLGILAFVAIFIFTFNAYRTAKDYGRNPVAWAAIVFGVGLGIQLVVPVLLSIVITVVMIARGSTIPEVEAAIFWPVTIIGVVCIIASLFAMYKLIGFLSNVPEGAGEGDNMPPPPPPNFDIG